MTVDSIWLVFALRFGVPAVALLFLSNVSSFLPVKSARGRRNRNDDAPAVSATDKYMADMSMAFTTVLVMFMFIGLTVHFWNYMWIFWGICLGVRASLREWHLAGGQVDQFAPVSRLVPTPLRARYS
jgi:hypothetical protein